MCTSVSATKNLLTAGRILVLDYINRGMHTYRYGIITKDGKVNAIVNAKVSTAENEPFAFHVNKDTKTDITLTYVDNFNEYLYTVGSTLTCAIGILEVFNSFEDLMLDKPIWKRMYDYGYLLVQNINDNGGVINTHTSTFNRKGYEEDTEYSVKVVLDLIEVNKPAKDDDEGEEEITINFEDKEAFARFKEFWNYITKDKG